MTDLTDLQDKIARLCVETKASPEDICRVIKGTTDVTVDPAQEDLLDGFGKEDLEKILAAFVEIDAYQIFNGERTPDSFVQNARSAIGDIRAALWPNGDLNQEWDADTLDQIVAILRSAGFAPEGALVVNLGVSVVWGDMTDTNAVSPIESTDMVGIQHVVRPETQYLYYVIPSRPENKKYLVISGENLSYPASPMKDYRKRTKAREALGTQLIDLPGIIIAHVENTNADYISFKIRNPGTKIMIKMLVNAENQEATKTRVEEYLKATAPYLAGGTWHDDLPGKQTT